MSTRPNSKYAPLYDYLNECPHQKTALTFNEINKLITPNRLPKTALNTRQWWANTRRNTQSKNWMDAGWGVDYVTNSAVIFWRLC